MQTRLIDRREALGGFAALFGTALVTPLRRAIEYGADPASEPATEILTRGHRMLLDALCERIIPTTDTPGAMEAGVTRYIEMILDAYADSGTRNQFLDDIVAVDAASFLKYGAAFTKLPEQEQDEIIATAERGSLDGASESFFPTLLQFTLTGYYTSEIGMTVERVFLPLPGRYDGAYPYEKVGKLFTF